MFQRNQSTQIFIPEDGGSDCLSNVGICLPDYTVSMKMDFSEMCCHVVQYKFTNNSEESTASIFRAKELAKQAASRVSHACYLLSVVFNPEDGGNTFLGNISILLPDTSPYTAVFIFTDLRT
jgi:hypothetical protein